MRQVQREIFIIPKMIIIISIYFASLFAASNEGNVFRPLVFLDWDMTLVHNPRTETGRHREAMTDAHLATLTAYFEKWNSVNFIITRGSIPTDSPIPEKFIPPMVNCFFSLKTKFPSLLFEQLF